jgi:hypothetical protein
MLYIHELCNNKSGWEFLSLFFAMLKSNMVNNVTESDEFKVLEEVVEVHNTNWQLEICIPARRSCVIE